MIPLEDPSEAERDAYSWDWKGAGISTITQRRISGGSARSPALSPTKAIPEGVGMSCGNPCWNWWQIPMGKSGGAETAPSLLPAGGTQPVLSSPEAPGNLVGVGGAAVLLRTAVSKGAGKRRRETGAWCIWRQPFRSLLLLLFSSSKERYERVAVFFVCFPKGDGKWAFLPLSRIFLCPL